MSKIVNSIGLLMDIIGVIILWRMVCPKLLVVVDIL
jgi:hypothetical protein